LWGARGAAIPQQHSLGTVRLLEQLRRRPSGLARSHAMPGLAARLFESRSWRRCSDRFKRPTARTPGRHGGTATILARIHVKTAEFDRDQIEATSLTLGTFGPNWNPNGK